MTVKKKKVTSKPITRRKKPTVFVVDEYLDLKDYKRKPVTNTYLERLAKKLSDWAEEPHAFRLHQFSKKEGIPYTHLGRFKEKSEVFKLAYEDVLLTIADRRELAGLKREMDSRMISSSLAHYCPIAKEQAIFKAQLTQKEEDKDRQIIVVLPDLTTEKRAIPEKKKDLWEVA